MILFKACPRCRGDVDATYSDDIYCVQCAHRPAVTFPGPRIAEVQAPTAGADAGSGPALMAGEALRPARVSGMGEATVCPKCSTEGAVQLDKLRPQDNICYRCRSCGHIFSPSPGETRDRPGAALR